VREEAATGELVTDAWHATIRIEDPLVRALLRGLDGTMSRAEHAARLHAIAGSTTSQTEMARRIDGALDGLAKLGLLE
jgi:hypothetical protein